MPQNTTPATNEEIAEAKPNWSEMETMVFMDLIKAYNNAQSNDECAEILRLFCTDMNSFKDKFGAPTFDRWLKNN